MSPDVLSFCSALAHGIVQFLLCEPIVYFTGIMIFLSVGHIVRKIVS